MPFVNTRKHFRIWFSADPKIFLNLENQLRMVKFRVDNPDAKMDLIYSSGLLNSDAKKQMLEFCNKYGFNAVDFDDDIVKLCETDQDKRLYEIAKLEIEAFVNKVGGNLAAASDATRFITKVIENGIYSDFDTMIKVKKLSEYAESEDAVLLNATTVSIWLQKAFLLNNDIICISKEDGLITPEAKKQLIFYQKSIISAYSEPVFNILKNESQFNTLKLLYMNENFEILEKIDPKMSVIKFRQYIDNSMKCVFGDLRVLPKIVTAISTSIGTDTADKLRKALENPDIFDFNESFSEKEVHEIKNKYLEESKKYINDFLENDEFSPTAKEYKSLLKIVSPEEYVLKKSTIIDSAGFASYKDSVSYFSGPGRLISCLLDNNGPGRVEQIIEKVAINNNTELAPSLVSYQFTNNLDITNAKSDMSWMKSGQIKMQEKERKMNESVPRLQKFFRKKTNEKKAKIVHESNNKEESGNKGTKGKKL